MIVSTIEPNLANDISLEYNRIITGNIYLNVAFSVSYAGKGIESIVGK